MDHMVVQLLVVVAVVQELTQQADPRVAHNQPVVHNPVVVQAQHFKGVQVEMVPNGLLNPVFEATVHATEEAITNALIAAETMKGADDNLAYALPHDRLVQILKKYNR